MSYDLAGTIWYLCFIGIIACIPLAFVSGALASSRIATKFTEPMLFIFLLVVPWVFIACLGGLIAVWQLGGLY